MEHEEAAMRVGKPALNPRLYLRQCIQSLEIEIADIRGRRGSRSADRHRLAEAELELRLAVAELASLEQVNEASGPVP